MLRWLIAGCFLCAGSGLAADPIDYGKKSSVGNVASVSLMQSQAAGYRDFKRNAGYFGAFYANDTIDEWHAVFFFHSPSKSRKVAKKLCEIRSSGVGKCGLVGIAYPSGRDPNKPHEGGIGVNARNEFADYLQKRIRPDGKFGAFAVAYEIGSSWYYTSRKEAIATAMAACEKDVATGLAGLSRREQQLVKRSGITKCELIDVWGD